LEQAVAAVPFGRRDDVRVQIPTAGDLREEFRIYAIIPRLVRFGLSPF
jgi:hypothetical protein